MQHLIEMSETGSVIKDIDLVESLKRWQHPWLLSHRVNLHDQLKKLATGPDGIGAPAKLHTSSKVVQVDPESGTVKLEDGTTNSADLVIGADGIFVSFLPRSASYFLLTGVFQSITRACIKDAELFGSGKAAFRFLIPRKLARDDPVTKHIGENENTLLMWYGQDRRVVV